MTTTKRSWGLSPEEPAVSLTGRYNMSQAAAALGVHRHSIANYFNSGQLRAINPCATRVHFYGRELRRFWNWKKENDG